MEGKVETRERGPAHQRGYSKQRAGWWWGHLWLPPSCLFPTSCQCLPLAKPKKSQWPGALGNFRWQKQTAEMESKEAKSREWSEWQQANDQPKGQERAIPSDLLALLPKWTSLQWRISIRWPERLRIIVIPLFVLCKALSKGDMVKWKENTLGKRELWCLNNSNMKGKEIEEANLLRSSPQLNNHFYQIGENLL